jgi:RHS repeat-associated protein
MNTSEIGTWLLGNELASVFPLKKQNDLLSLQEAESLARQKLQAFARSSDFSVKMKVAFGEGVDVSELQDAWEAGEVRFPTIEIRSAAELNGARGAFAIATNTIYLSSEFISQNADNLDAITAVLLEEFGHSVDARLNQQDAAGDEGAIFSALVREDLLDGRELQQLKTEDDKALIVLDGREIQIEQANNLPDLAGNTFVAAKDIGVLSISQTLRDLIGGNDSYDYYRFDLGENSSLALNLSGLSTDANLYLYSLGGTLQASSANSETTDESINKNLPAGTYFALVRSFSGSTNYTLQLEANSLGSTPTDVDGGNYGFNTALNLGIITNTPQTYRDFVGNFNGLVEDYFDFYSLQLTDNSTLTLDLGGLTSDADLMLYDVGGAVLANSATSGTTNEVINRNLKAGTYFVRVGKSGSGSTTYNLETSAISLGAIPADTAGRQRETARDIGVLSTTPLTINEFVGKFYDLNEDPADFYQFEVSENSTVTLNLSGLSADASLNLYKSDGSFYRSSTNGGNADESISVDLTPGTYFAEVSQPASGGTSYTFQASATPIITSIPNTSTSFDTAQNIGTLGSLQTINDTVDSTSNLTDVYQFELTENSAVNLNLSGLSSDANLSLYVRGGRQLSQSANSGTTDESIALNLAPNTYYITVDKSGSGSTPYTLQASATALGIPAVDLVGDTFTMAQDLGVLSTPQTTSDFVSDITGLVADTDDYYRFELNENSTLNLSLSGLSSDANLYLYSPFTGGSILVASSGNGGTSDESISRNLLPGIYFAKVQKAVSGVTPYTLQASTTSLGAYSDNAGNTPETARNVGILTSTSQNFTDFVGNFNGLISDNDDYYRLQLPENSTLTLNLSGVSSDVNAALSLYNVGGGLLGAVGSPGIPGQVLSLSRNLEAGTYLVRTFGISGNTYNLEATTSSLFPTPPDLAGNTRDEARDIGILSGTQVFNDFVGNFLDIPTAFDNYDYYRFEVAADSKVNLALGNLDAGTSARIELLDDYRGQVITSSSSSIDLNLLSGIYFVRVSSTSPNGTSYSLTTTATAIPDYAGNSLDGARNLGILAGTQTFSDFVGDIDPNDYYRFELRQDSAVNLSLGGENPGTDAVVWLLDSKGKLINNSSTTLNANLDAGTYYLRTFASGNTPYNLSASATPTTISPNLQIRSVTPDGGSNAGQVTLTIEGTRFTPDASVRLISPGGTSQNATQVTWLDDTTLTATFNLNGLATGAYDVRVTEGADFVTAPDVFTVNNTSPGQLEVFLSVPSMIRPWWKSEILVTYRNTGNTDIPVPLFTLESDNAILEVSGQRKYPGSSIQFWGSDTQGTPGTLAPGEEGTSTLFFYLPPTLVSPGPGPAPVIPTSINFTLKTLTPNAAIDWNAIQDSSRPDLIPAEGWDVIYSNFTTAVGGTTDSYQRVLGENANTFGQQGNYTTDVSRLLGFEFLQASNSLVGATLGSIIDAVAPTPGLSLFFGRTYQQNLAGRFTLGAFGRGWTHPWDVLAATDSEGNVTLRDSGSFRVFTKQTDGSYQSQAGDYGTLTLQGGVYHLLEKGGTELRFRTDGLLDYVEELNGNRVTLGYTGSQLTSLNHSNGDSFALTYNPQGRVSQLTDQAGRTTTYSYDASGERLLSVTGPDGTIAYTYDSSTTGANAHALRQITFPDATNLFFNYDSQGRLIEQKLDGDAETLTYTYDSAGGVAVTDGTGAKAHFLLQDRGLVGQTQDALGRTTQFRYNDSGNLTQLVAPDNSLSSFTYDSRGNLLSAIDPLGQRVDLTYDLRFDQIASVSDPKGNITNYSYDSLGNLQELLYADGSFERFGYDTAGNLVVSANRRGQVIDYTYDPRGLLLRKDYADGTAATFTYDTRGNLLSATDADSNVSYTYDSGDRLLRADQGSGRFVEYTYDAGGRRTRMTDPNGTVNYAYDAAGRLSELTDGSGNRIIAYSYDATGQLAREDNGNGTYTTYTYDAAGQALNIVNFMASGAVNSRYDYAYDSLGRRTSMTTLEGTTQYGYDRAGQLTSVTLPGGRTIEYQYDAAGNRITVNDSGATTAYSSNNLNQYETVGSAIYTYDLDGNLIAKTEGSNTWTYSYDNENRLIRAVTPEGTWDYQYDALGNRIASSKDGQRTEYLLDPTGLVDVVGEYNSGGLVARYTHGLGLVSRTNGSNTAYYDADAIGSVVGLTGATGGYLNRYSYLPFGEDLTKVEGVANPFEYVGQWGVMDEGNGLDFMRARYYSPGVGSFMSADPLGIGGGDPNLYRYGFNNSVSAVDPSGENPVIVEVVILGALLLLAGVFVAGFFGSKIPEFTKPTPPQQLPVHIPNGQPGRLDSDEYYEYNYHEIPSGGKFCVKVEEYNTVQDALGGAGLLGNVPKRPWWQRFLPLPFDTLPLPELPDLPWVEGIVRILISNDPNDIIGPAGFGTDRWLTPDQVLPYAIRFENQASATAPAVVVNISHQLDSDLDLSTFELGDFGFGKIYVDVPDGLQTYSTRLDLRDRIGDFVDFTASLNPATRTVTWQLTTVDPFTGGLPPEIDAGFLPPNNATHDGEGFVNYKIQPLASATTGTAIDAQARIVFDTNAPIDTPVWSNKLDSNDPTSSVTTLPATTSNPNFTVSWSGTDSGSGIADYDVYVSIDGSPFTLWLNDTTDISAIYNGEVGKTYAFYSVARDNVGYLEAIPIIADTQTTVASINNPPVAEADKILTVNEDATPTALNIAAPTDADNDTLTLTVNTLPDSTKGKVQLSDGTDLAVNQPLSIADLTGLIFVPLSNANGVAGAFSYTVSDGKGGTDSQIVTLEITPVNDPATITGTTTATVTEDTNVDGDGKLNATGTLTVSDVDAGEDKFNITVTSATGNLGSLSISEAGNFSYSVDNSAIQSLGQDLTKIDTFTVQSFDGTASQDITVTITGVNDLATISGTATATVTEDTNVDGNGKLNATGTLTVSDVDAGEDKFNTTVTSATGNIGSLSISEAGNFSYSVDNSAVQSLGQDLTKIDTFTVQSFDGTANQEIAITIVGVNDIPTLQNAIADQNATANQSFNFTFAQDTFSDVDAGDTLTYSATLENGDPLPDWLSFDAATRTFSGTPTTSDTGSINIQVTASDSQNATAVDVFSLTVAVSNLINGDDTDNTLSGTPEADIINGFGGNDYITGLAGNDTIDGGTGKFDRMFGNDGDDTIIDPDGVLGAHGKANNDTINVTFASSWDNDSNPTNAPRSDGKITGGYGDDNITVTMNNSKFFINLKGDEPTNSSQDGNDVVTLLGRYQNAVIDLGGGNDTFNGGSGSDNISGKAGNDILLGNGGNDQLAGNNGNDTLVGGAGNDKLTGGCGQDNFSFSSPNEKIDRITDFTPVDDTISVDDVGFGGGLLVGTLLDTQFVLGTAATDTDDRFIYNQSTGALFFDIDGTGASAKIQIATLTTKPVISFEDIVVI